MSNETDLDNILSFIREDLDIINKDVSDTAETVIIQERNYEEEEEEEEEELPFFSNHLLNKELNSDNRDMNSYKFVLRENQEYCLIPITKSKENDTFCKITCNQYISYKILSTIEYKTFDLEKLDIVLSTNSILPIEIECTLNGLNVLEYPNWISEPLNSVMSSANFKNVSLDESKDGLFHYQIQKAFVTTPLSYLLQVQAPHGILDKLYIHLDWTTTNSKKFQSNWLNNSDREYMLQYIKDALISILSKKIFNNYPLIFSDAFVKRTVPIISQLPRIARSLQKMIKISKDTDPHSEFHDILSRNLKIIEKNTHVMRPLFIKEDDLVSNLTLGMYYTVTRKSNMSTTNSLRSQNQSSPNALNAVTKIWSIMVSALPDDEI